MGNNELITFSPKQVGEMTVSLVEELKKNPNSGIRAGVQELDKYMLPMRPGDMVMVIGRPSNFKTGLALSIAKSQCDAIKSKKEKNSVVVYATWETAVEESGLIDLTSGNGLNRTSILRGIITDGDMEILKDSAILRTKEPMWIVGHSIAHRKKRPNLDIASVVGAMEYIEEQGKEIKLIIIDYLQLVQARGFSSDKGARVAHVVQECKNMALRYACPILVLCQAKREVDLREFRLPRYGDGMWTSEIEHAADKILTVWMPKTSIPQGVNVPLLKADYLTKSEPNLLLIALDKQRWGEAQNVIKAEIDFDTYRIRNSEDYTRALVVGIGG